MLSRKNKRWQDFQAAIAPIDEILIKDMWPIIYSYWLNVKLFENPILFRPPHAFATIQEEKDLTEAINRNEYSEYKITAENMAQFIAPAPQVITKLFRRVRQKGFILKIDAPNKVNIANEEKSFEPPAANNRNYTPLHDLSSQPSLSNEEDMKLIEELKNHQNDFYYAREIIKARDEALRTGVDSISLEDILVEEKNYQEIRVDSQTQLPTRCRDRLPAIMQIVFLSYILIADATLIFLNEKTKMAMKIGVGILLPGYFYFCSQMLLESLSYYGKKVMNSTLFWKSAIIINTLFLAAINFFNNTFVYLKRERDLFLEIIFVIAFMKNIIDALLQATAFFIIQKRMTDCYNLLGCKALLKEIGEALPFLLPTLLTILLSPLARKLESIEHNVIEIPAIIAALLLTAFNLIHLFPQIITSRRLFDECKELIGIKEPIVTVVDSNKWKTAARHISRASYSIYSALVYYSLNYPWYHIMLVGMSDFVRSFYPTAVRISSQPFILLPAPRPAPIVTDNAAALNERDVVLEMPLIAPAEAKRIG